MRENALEQDLSDIRFDDWIKSVFDHPVADPAWYGEVEFDTQWDGITPSITVQYVTRLFTNSQQVLGQYPDDQVNHGLWHLVDPACSDIMRDALDACVLLPERLTCIHSILLLFRDCFAPRCSSTVSHNDEAGTNPINSVCYMWWDVFPAPGPGHAEENQAILDVMRDTLTIPSIACQESAIHGLGHWQLWYPRQAKQIIDTFLAATPDLSKPLREYALEAKAGRVL
jgi:hypothetical protein